MAALEAEFEETIIAEPEESSVRLVEPEESGIIPAQIPSSPEHVLIDEETHRIHREIIEQFFDQNPHEKTGFTD